VTYAHLSFQNARSVGNVRAARGTYEWMENPAREILARLRLQEAWSLECPTEEKSS